MSPRVAFALVLPRASARRAPPPPSSSSSSSRPSKRARPRASAALQSLQPAMMSYGALVRATSVCVEAHRFDAVISLFDEASARPALQTRFTARLYSHVFFSLMKLGKPAHAVRAFELLLHIESHALTSTLIGPRAFNFIFVLVSRVCMVDEARRVRELCYQQGYYLNRYSYNAFLNACAKGQRLDDAFATLTEMAEHKVSPDVVSFNVLISCCVRVGSVDIALTILSRMKDWGIQPDIYSYNSVINGLRKSNMLDQAFELVAQMERDSLSESHSSIVNTEGRGVAPDLVTYNTLLSALACLERPDFSRALRVKGHMESRGIDCNEVSYNALMATAAKSDHVDQAFGIYEEMISRQLKPNCECFTTLIMLCGRANMFEKAFQVHADMLSCGIVSNVITYNALLTACRGCERDNGDESLRLLDIMKNATDCEPDVITYSTVIDTLGRNERFEEMHKVFHEMQRAGVRPNLVTYTSMISGMTRANRLEEAIKVLNAMERHGVEPNVYTFSSLINGAAKRSDFACAMDILELMSSKKVLPSRITYTILIQLAVRLSKQKYLDHVIEEISADSRSSEAGVSSLEDLLNRPDLFNWFKSRSFVRQVADLVGECLE